MVDLTDWQIRQVRNALLHFYQRERDAEGRRYNWSTVWHEISDYVDSKNGTLDYTEKHGSERLRQFVMGVDDPASPAKKRYPTPKADLLEAIADFIVDENSDILCREELNQTMPSWHAMLKLLNYLQRKKSNITVENPRVLEGTYRTIHDDGDGLTTIRTLDFQSATRDGLIEVMEVEDVYPSGYISKINSMTRPELAEIRDIRYIYRGWAVLTPELNLSIYLKESKAEVNRHYFTVASDIALKLDRQAEIMILLDHDYPFEPEREEAEKIDLFYSRIMDQMKIKLLPFTRW